MANRFLILIFAILLGLPLAVGMRTWKAADSLSEKRRLAELPDWREDPVASWPGAIDAAFQDHFGFRQKLIKTRSAFYLECLHMSPSPKVIAGKDGWLYYLKEDRLKETALSDHQGLRAFSEDELKTIAETIEYKKSWLEEREIRYMFVVAPNKESIYPEYLPRWVHRYGDRTRLDQLMAYLRAHTTAEILDLRPNLLEAKGPALIYEKQDTHWSHRGALIAYQDVCTRLQRWFPSIEPLGIEDFVVTKTRWPGDLFCMLGLWPRKDLWGHIEKLSPKTPFTSLEIESDLDPRQPWPEWASSNLPVTKVNPSQDLRAVFFCDSFFRNPFNRNCFASHFRHSDFLVLRPTMHLLKVIIPLERPDVVIEERVERTLCEMPDYFGTPEPLEVELDGDRDGMLDEWETSVGLDPSVSDAQADEDQDGFTNQEEYEARTWPMDPQSKPGPDDGT